MVTYQVDLSRFTREGYGVLSGDFGDMTPGDMIAVTDEDADVIAAEVVEVHEGSAKIRVFWDSVLRRS